MGPSLRNWSNSSTTSEEDDVAPKKASLNEDDSDSAYHSLDSRTDSDGEQLVNAETQSECDPIAQESKTIARDILNAMYPVDPNLSSPRNRSSYTRTVVRLVNEILDKHSTVYNSIVKTIKASEFDKRQSSLNVMCDELFKGEIVTWGRILALFALCYQIAHHYGQHKEDRIEALLICDFVGHYLGEKATKWVREEGGWDSLEVAFPAKDAVEKKVWRSLLVTGLSLGVLATVIKVVR